eukprot:330010-Amphidinium_carterae.1
MSHTLYKGWWDGGARGVVLCGVAPLRGEGRGNMEPTQDELTSVSTVVDACVWSQIPVPARDAFLEAC